MGNTLDHLDHLDQLPAWLLSDTPPPPPAPLPPTPPPAPSSEAAESVPVESDTEAAMEWWDAEVTTAEESAPCERCGRIMPWWDGLGNRRCTHCEPGPLERSLRLAKRAQRLRRVSVKDRADVPSLSHGLDLGTPPTASPPLPAADQASPPGGDSGADLFVSRMVKRADHEQVMGGEKELTP